MFASDFGRATKGAGDRLNVEHRTGSRVCVGGYQGVRGLSIIRMRPQKKYKTKKIKNKKDCGETVGAWGSKKKNTKYRKARLEVKRQQSKKNTAVAGGW